MKKYKIYEFEYFNLNHIENKFGKGRKYGVGKFLSKLYKRTIVFKDIDESDGYELNKGFVYLSKSEIERYLGYNKKEGKLDVLYQTYQPILYFKETRCDLHPRFHHGKIFFDQICDGKRKLSMIDNF